jgi:hypothetical protein
VFPAGKVYRQEPRRISKGSIEVKKIAMAKSTTASILQRFDNDNFDYPSAHWILRFLVVETTIIRSLAGLRKRAAFA